MLKANRAMFTNLSQVYSNIDFCSAIIIKVNQKINLKNTKIHSNDGCGRYSVGVDLPIKSNKLKVVISKTANQT